MRAFLIASLIANVILAAALGWVRSLPATGPILSPGSRQPSHAQTNGASPEVRTVVIRGKPITFTWPMIASPDDRRFVANLRLIGCPEDTIRDIVAAALSRRYFDRHWQELEKTYRDFRYWDNDHGLLTVLTLESRERLREERNQVIAALLGGASPRPADPRDGATMERMDWSFVAPEKRESADAIRRKYGLLERQLQVRAAADFWGVSLADEERKLYAARRVELAQVLTSAELEELEYRDSPAARSVRARPNGARSEEEFRGNVALARRYGPGSGVEIDVEPAPVPMPPPPTVVPAVIEPQPAVVPQPVTMEVSEVPDEPVPEDPRTRWLEVARQSGIDPGRASLAYNRAVQLVDQYQRSIGDGSRLPAEQRTMLQRALRLQMERLFVETMGPRGTNLVREFLTNTQ